MSGTSSGCGVDTVLQTLCRRVSGDSLVWFLYKVNGKIVHCDYAFDYWGKGTTVTVTSDVTTSPSVFPVMPCNSDSGDTLTLACLATGFTPSTVSFSWTHNDTALTDFIQYPSVLQNNVYSGVSQIRVRRQDWEDRHMFKCTVNHAGSVTEVQFVRPITIYRLPNLKLMTSEENEEKVTFSCLANDFSPNVFDFKWLKDNKEVSDTSLEFTTPSKAGKSTNGTMYTAASFLTLPTQELSEDTKLTCKFNVGRGGNQKSMNSSQEYRLQCPNTGSDVLEGFSMKIIPPTLEEMLYKRLGQVRCEVMVKDPRRVFSVSWTNEKGDVLMNNTDKGATVNGGHFVLALDVTYEEWNRGIKRICEMGHMDSQQLLKEVYERKNDVNSQKAPSVFMLTPLIQTKEGTVTLTCYVKDFYPKELYVMWLVDDKESMHDFNTTNSVRTNGAYYAYSHLTVPLSEWDQPDQVFSCLVYHESLDENKTIVRSITQHLSQQATMVNLNMRVPDMCKAQ